MFTVRRFGVALVVLLTACSDYDGQRDGGAWEVAGAGPARLGLPGSETRVEPIEPVAEGLDLAAVGAPLRAAIA